MRLTLTPRLVMWLGQAWHKAERSEAYYLDNTGFADMPTSTFRQKYRQRRRKLNKISKEGRRRNRI